MEVYCTRPNCPKPTNYYADLDQNATLQTVQQKFCTGCGMPLILAGRYLPQKLLGRGGFGAAFLAIDRYTPTLRQCVVKQFQPIGDLSPAQMQIAQDLFNREAEILEQIGNKHPLIPDLFAFFPLIVDTPSRTGQTELFYIVQEFIDGQDLEQELAQKGSFSETEVREILDSVLKTLQFVHDSGVIHRDIKPSNIMRDRSGKLYLLDFGAVKRVTAKASQSGSNQSTGIYSMGFAPPEQMAGSTVYPATDLYALAVTCITLLTGKQPNDLYDSYSNGWNWHPHAQVGGQLAAILDKMLMPTPSQRFQSAQDVMDALAGTTPAARHPQPSPNPSSSATTAPTGMPPTSAGTALQSPSPAMLPIQPATPAPITPAPSQSVASQQSAPASGQPNSSFNLLEFLGGAAFTGVEGALLAIALFSLSFLGTLVSGIFWVVLIAALIFFQSRRTIERVDLLIIAGLTLLIVLFVPPFQSLPLLQASGSSRLLTIILAVMGGLVVVAAATLFRLIYSVLARFL